MNIDFGVDVGLAIRALRDSQSSSLIDGTWLRTAFSTSTALASIDFTKLGFFSIC